MTRTYLVLSFAIGVLAAANGVQAQSFSVTAGEHADFTRLVVQGPITADWSLDDTGRQRRLHLGSADIRTDLTRTFDRIPRTRLTDLRRVADGLSFELACDCAIRAWLDRPGLLIVDISDPLPAPNDAAVAPIAATVIPSVDILATARLAGAALARALPTSAGAPEASAPVPLSTEDIGRPIARALAQGLLDPATIYAQPRGSLMPASPATEELPENMRIASVLDRADPAARIEIGPEGSLCTGAAELDFLNEPRTEPFGAAFGRLARDLYGEFDQPDPRHRLALVQLYLASGFGAEARALLETSPDPIPGRDLMIGMADVLEGRSSNSRMRLAQVADCGGPAAVVASLAGETTTANPRGSDATALTFTRLPAPLRAILGPDLAERLAAAGDIDAARIIVDSVRRSPWTQPDRLEILDARLDQARGRPAAGTARLDHAAPDGLAALQARLDLALETHQVPAMQLLADAEMLAGLDRQSTPGSDLMSSAIRLHALGGTYEQGFAALDRLAGWIADTSENRALLSDLADTLWSSVAGSADDLALTRMILARDDWRGDGLAAPTRRDLATRLLELGLPGPVAAMLRDEAHDPRAARLLARAALAMGHPDQALSLASLDPHPESRLLRAEALTLLDDPQAAAAELAALDDAPTLARALILARDWRALEQLPAGTWPAEMALTGIGALLGRPPGHAQAQAGSPLAAQPVFAPARGQSPPDPASDAVRRVVPEARIAGAPAAPTRAASPRIDTPTPVAAAASAGAPGALDFATDPGPADLGRLEVAPDAVEAAARIAARPAGAAVPIAAEPAQVLPSAPAASGATARSGALTGGPEAAGSPRPGTTRSAPAANDPGALAFDRLGMIGRSTTLLAESARLRETLLPLLPAPTE